LATEGLATTSERRCVPHTAEAYESQAVFSCLGDFYVFPCCVDGGYATPCSYCFHHCVHGYIGTRYIGCWLDERAMVDWKNRGASGASST